MHIIIKYLAFITSLCAHVAGAVVMYMALFSPVPPMGGTISDAISPLGGRYAQPVWTFYIWFGFYIGQTIAWLYMVLGMMMSKYYFISESVSTTGLLAHTLHCALYITYSFMVTNNYTLFSFIALKLMLICSMATLYSFAYGYVREAPTTRARRVGQVLFVLNPISAMTGWLMYACMASLQTLLTYGSLADGKTHGANSEDSMTVSLSVMLVVIFVRITLDLTLARRWANYYIADRLVLSVVFVIYTIIYFDTTVSVNNSALLVTNTLLLGIGVVLKMTLFCYKCSTPLGKQLKTQKTI